MPDMELMEDVFDEVQRLMKFLRVEEAKQQAWCFEISAISSKKAPPKFLVFQPNAR
jgi:hypothetical protein